MQGAKDNLFLEKMQIGDSISSQKKRGQKNKQINAYLTSKLQFRSLLNASLSLLIVNNTRFQHPLFTSAVGNVVSLVEGKIEM